MKRKTNVERITEIMEFSKAGPLAQSFIICAIEKYAAQVADNADEIRESMKNSFIDGDAWIRTAKIVSAELDAAYKEDAA